MFFATVSPQTEKNTLNRSNIVEVSKNTIGKYGITRKEFAEFSQYLVEQDVQSDWNATDNTSLSYIANKPAIKSGTGTNSTAEGSGCQATGKDAHAEGLDSIASGNHSHAEGSTTQALGADSHAEGVATISNEWGQHVQGKYNIADSTKAHIVGGGTSDTDRKNIHTIDWDGNAYFAGTISDKDGDLRQTIKDHVASTYATKTALEGRAPAGYVDEICIISDFTELLPKINTLLSKMDNRSEYHLACSVQNWANNIPSGEYIVTIYKEYSNYAFVSAKNSTAQLQNSLKNGVWGEWEWENPPMNAGVEYRTTERYNGNTVYVKLVDYGQLPQYVRNEPSGITGKIFDFDAIAYKFNGTVHKFPMVSTIDGSVIATVFLNADNNINIKVFSEKFTDYTEYSAKCIIKYTK